MKTREVQFLKVHQSVMSIAGRECLSFRKMGPGQVPAYPDGMSIHYLVDEQIYIVVYGEKDHVIIHPTNVIEAEYTPDAFEALFTESGAQSEPKRRGRPPMNKEVTTAA